MRERDLRQLRRFAVFACVWMTFIGGAVPAQTARGGQPESKVGASSRDLAENGLRALVTVKLGLPSLSAEEAETLLAQPIESRLRHRPEVQSVRSMSAKGQSILWIGLDAKASGSPSSRHAIREAVAEELRSEFKRAPRRSPPYLAPEVAGKIVLVALRSRDGQAQRSPEELRAVADYLLRPQLLAVPGVADVMVTGGKVNQLRILPDPDRLRAYNLTLLEAIRTLEEGVKEASKPVVPPGEAPRPALTAGDLGELVISTRNAQIMRLRDVAVVRVEGSTPEVDLDADTQKEISAEPAVVLAVCRAPDLDGIDESRLQRDLNSRLDELQTSLPHDVVLQRKVPKELARLLEKAVSKIRRDLPPEWTLQQVATEGQVTALVPKLRPQRVARLLGPDRARLGDAAKGLADRLRAVPGVTQVQVEPEGLVPDLEFQIDRERAAKLGVTTGDISDTIEAVRGGRVVGRLEKFPGGGPRDIVVTCPGPNRGDGADVGRIEVRGTSGETTPLATLVTVRAKISPRSLYREHGRPAVLVFCTINANDQARAQPEVQQAVLAAERRLRGSSGDYRVSFD